MIIKSKTTWKDHVEGPKHKGISRRDLLKQGLATGLLSLAIPKSLGLDIIRSAEAGTLACPKAFKNPGAIAQIYANGGASMGARFIGHAQAESMNSTMASNYGITGTNLKQIGPGIVVDSTSVFGMTLLAGPPGFPGGSAAWQSQVLKNTSGGGHLGPFTFDDAVGSNQGMLGSTSLDRPSYLNKDIWFNPVGVKARWANGTPAAFVGPFGTPDPGVLQNAFTLKPAAATGHTTAQQMTLAADGAVSIAQAFDASTKMSSRRGASQIMSSAGCALYGNQALTDPAFAANLFNVSALPDLAKAMTVASLTSEDLALAASFYQSAMGQVGGVVVQYGGRDYHGTDPQAVITPADYEDARSIVMFLASCYAANQRGVLIYVSNGQCIANGVQQTTHMLNGTSTTFNCPVGIGDAGGFYNAGLMIFYNPTGSVPVARYTGTLNTTNGSVKADVNVGSPANAFAGLFMTAHQYLSGSVPQSLMNRLKGANLAPLPSALMLI